MYPTTRRRGLFAALVATAALTLAACNTGDSSTNGGTSGGGGTVAVVADPKLTTVQPNCYAEGKSHWFKIKASGLSPHFRYNLYLYRASADTKDPKNVFLTLHGKANSAGKVSQSFSCRDKVYKGGADKMILEEASSLRRSNIAFFDVLRAK